MKRHLYFLSLKMSENKVNVVLQEGELKEKGVFTVVNNPHRRYSEAVADYYYTG